MYLEKLKELTYNDYTTIYSSLDRNKCFLLSENDFNLLFYMYKQDIKYIIFKLLKIKYPQNEFKLGTYKTNQFQYNEMAYIIDCNNFYGLELKDFIQEYGTNYILTHEIDIDQEDANIKIVNLNKKSETFFEYIKVIQYAKEIHLLDSVWAAVIYLLDTKYGLFADKQINVYCNRGYNKMFEEPIRPRNWCIRSK
jgi:hypothetical protein